MHTGFDFSARCVYHIDIVPTPEWGWEQQQMFLQTSAVWEEVKAGCCVIYGKK